MRHRWCRWRNCKPNAEFRIERELADTRARLGSHLDELARRLSPGQLLDEGLAYLRDGQGAVFARNLGRQLRDNPRRGMRSWHGSPKRARILGVQRNAAETASAFADRVQQAMDSAQRSAMEKLGEMRRAAAGKLRDGIAERGQRAGEAMSQAAYRGRDLASRAGSGIADTVAENPLLLGALGLTAGVLLGALLPRTEQEEALIGPATDMAAGAVRDVAGEVVDSGSRAAEAAASAAWEAARE